MAALLRGVAFIPGAASGIGQHTALSFAKHGMKALALADINGEALAKSAAALREKCADVKTVELQFDVRDSTSIKSKLTEAVEELGGRLDVAVNNAGIGGGGKPTPEASEEEWLRIIDVDLHGVWRCQKEENCHYVEARTPWATYWSWCYHQCRSWDHYRSIGVCSRKI